MLQQSWDIQQQFYSKLLINITELFNRNIYAPTVIIFLHMQDALFTTTCNRKLIIFLSCRWFWNKYNQIRWKPFSKRSSRVLNVHLFLLISLSCKNALDSLEQFCPSACFFSDVQREDDPLSCLFLEFCFSIFPFVSVDVLYF